MPIALATTSKYDTRRKRGLIVAGTLSGAYTTGGVPVDWTTVTNPLFLSAGKPSSNPKTAFVANSPAGYAAELIQGTTMKNWFLKIYSAPGTELAAAAFPAALLADPFAFEISGALGSF